MSLAGTLCCGQGNLGLEERNRLVLEQLPQVRYIAQKIHARLPHHIQLEDLINTGVLGLIEALAKYDPGRNVGLQSYARYRIQGAILDSLREQDWSPRLLRQKGRQLEQARETLRGRLGRSPSQSELAVELKIPEEHLHRLLSDLKGLEVASLQEPVFSDGHALGETMADTAEEDPFSLCQTAEMNGLLEQALSKLSFRKRQILELYYFKSMTMREVGNRMGVCESRISQIHSAALASLRARMREVLAARMKQNPLDAPPRVERAPAPSEAAPAPIAKAGALPQTQPSADRLSKERSRGLLPRRAKKVRLRIRKSPGRKVGTKQVSRF